jgi:mannose-6-phosphate isomerase-like protein (cupin superfamily)
MSRYFLPLLMIAPLFAADRAVDPTFLRRSVQDVAEKVMDISSPTCRYKPLFGAGDNQTSVIKGIARFGEMTVDAGGASKSIAYPREEQVYFVTEGAGELRYGDQKVPVRRNDFMYLPAGIGHGLSNSGGAPLRAIVMGFKLPAGSPAGDPPSKPLMANTDDVKLQVVGNHPPSTLYQLMIGDIHSTRDKIAAAHVLTSLFIMEIIPGGTNFPHHHEREEEIYLLLEGSGDMVAGGGTDGVEGRHPSKPGDAYFFRLNCTVGFYNTGAKKARILAVRSLFPFK